MKSSAEVAQAQGDTPQFPQWLRNVRAPAPLPPRNAEEVELLYRYVDNDRALLQKILVDNPGTAARGRVIDATASPSALTIVIIRESG
jgi:hypothetical protein